MSKTTWSKEYFKNDSSDGYIIKLAVDAGSCTMDDGSSTGSVSCGQGGMGAFSNGTSMYRRKITMKWHVQHKNGTKNYSTVTLVNGNGKDLHKETNLDGSWEPYHTGVGSTGYGYRVYLDYKCETSLAWKTNTYTVTYEKYLPAPVPTAKINSGSVSGPSSGYSNYSYTYKASGSATIPSGAVVRWRLLFNGAEVRSGTGSSFSTSYTGRFTSTGNKTVALQRQISDISGSTSGWENVATRSVYIQLPPPSPPTMGGVTNTTSENVTTSINKTISANWWLDYDGRLSTSFVAKAYKRDRVNGAVAEVYSYSGGGTSASTTISLALNENVDVYWVVTAVNSLGSNSVTSGSVRLHRIYTEPSNIGGITLSPTKIMMLDGITSVLYTLSVGVNGWGDRPGTHEIYIYQVQDNTTVKEVFRKIENGTGTTTCQFTSVVDESYLGDKLRFLVQKKIGGTVFNNTQGYSQFVNFYETPAVCTGSASMSRSVITKNKQLTVYYNYKYTKNSSEKVQFVLEIYDDTADKVVNSFTLQTRDRDYEYSGSQAVVPFPTDGEQEHKYYVRLKSIVTELRGNQTINVLGKSSLQYNYEPIVQFSQSASIPMNKIGSIIRFDSNMDYTQNTIYKDKINKCEVVIDSSHGRTIGDITGGSYTFVNPDEFTLDSSVKAFVRVYYDLGGQEETYDCPEIAVKVTPTRYVIWHTDNLVPEMKNPKFYYRQSAGAEGYAKKIEVKEG